MGCKIRKIRKGAKGRRFNNPKRPVKGGDMPVNLLPL